MSQYMEVVATQDLINDISSAVETQALGTKVDTSDVVSSLDAQTVSTKIPDAGAIIGYVTAQIGDAISASY